MEPTDLIVICDAGPIIHLMELDVLWLLEDFQTVVVSESVVNEVKNNRPSNSIPTHFEIITPPYPSSISLERLAGVFSLHKGEIDSLLIAIEKDATLFLTDDNAARLAANELEIRVHGTIGILIRAIRRKQLTKDRVLRILESIPDTSTLFIRHSLLADIIKTVNSHSA